LLGDTDHLISLTDVNRHRLFDQYMTAGPKTINAYRRVKRVGRHHNSDVGLEFSHHRPMFGIKGDSQLFGPLAPDWFVHIADADQFRRIQR
jgi:hypothetical protein